MKKVIIALLMVLPLSAMAQKFGYMNYNDVLTAMPEYLQAQNKLTDLKAQYKAETTRSEEDFNRKYNEFLEGQKDFPQNILQKRQKELQDLYQNGVQFREECEKLLKNAETELTNPAKAKLNAAIGQVGTEMQLDYIVNVENNNILFVGPNGIDITNAVLAKLGMQ
ncbi:MAG: OmpH family outer membrane protein [Bacteroidaceae bacterium]|nr:OmpH family outer membrane protein [Candidatus Minthousia equi]MCQ2245993.1 OmpH family outer membrane protein [Bacteroidaceae bacterium]MDO4956281.1 OmpH family outer membrane protein [Bacteroidales bacterium]